MSVFLSLLLVVVLAIALVWLVLIAFWSARHPEPHWAWEKLDTEVVRFPKGFIWGVATAAHQVEGNSDNNNWSAFENETAPDGSPRIKGGQKAGLACDHWNRYPEDIARMKELGVNSFRLSLAWCKLEPRPGEFDPAAIQHYHEVLDALKAAGLSAMVTLHHFTHPRWFEDLGAFEKEENLAHFVAFSRRMFEEYHEKVDFWCTINEPGVYATMGYFLGIFPPGKRDRALLPVVLRNLILGHAQVYHALKQLPGGRRARIGVVKNIFQFDPSRRWHLGDWLLCHIADAVYNKAILHYLRTGVFWLSIPGLIRYVRQDPQVLGAGDFVGLNYYSHLNARVKLSLSEPFSYQPRPDDVMTDMPYAIYAEGFKRALERIARLGLPIYVTENGVADDKDDRRATFIKRYLFAMNRAIEDGCDVRGYYYWTLCDNFEWAEGYDMKFGLYDLDHATQVRTLREGAREYQRLIREKTER